MSIGEARLQQLSGGTATPCRHPHERSAAFQNRDFKHISEKFASDFPLQGEREGYLKQNTARSGALASYRVRKLAIMASFSKAA